MMPSYSTLVNIPVKEKDREKVDNLYEKEQNLRNNFKRMITAMICIEVERGIKK